MGSSESDDAELRVLERIRLGIVPAAHLNTESPSFSNGSSSRILDFRCRANGIGRVQFAWHARHWPSVTALIGCGVEIPELGEGTEDGD